MRFTSIGVQQLKSNTWLPFHNFKRFAFINVQRARIRRFTFLRAFTKWNTSNSLPFFAVNYCRLLAAQSNNTV